MADQIASARKGLLAEYGYATKMTENRISNINRCGREVGLIQRALQQSTGGHDHIACAGAHRKCEKGYCQKGEQQLVLHTSPQSHAPSFGRTPGLKRDFCSGHLITARI